MIKDLAILIELVRLFFGDQTFGRVDEFALVACALIITALHRPSTCCESGINILLPFDFSEIFCRAPCFIVLQEPVLVQSSNTRPEADH